ncbi:15 kDa selenoprotein [Trichoplax sp. H2]|nr:15 kDa selenoprotein [Trichoplax sp. H2]|eukprot:RDD43452.1 15 kDa selenoprotein [Trichoplax sp. H2]
MAVPQTMAFPSSFLMVTLLISWLACTLASHSPEFCRGMGFSPNLLCNSCSDLKQFQLDPLVNDCQQCCTSEQNKEDSIHKYMRGQEPILKLINESNEVEDTLSIEKWKTENVEEYLQQIL